MSLMEYINCILLKVRKPKRITHNSLFLVTLGHVICFGIVSFSVECLGTKNISHRCRVSAAAQDEFSWMWHLSLARKLNVPLISDEFHTDVSRWWSWLMPTAFGNVMTGLFKKTLKRGENINALNCESFYTHIN